MSQVLRFDRRRRRRLSVPVDKQPDLRTLIDDLQVLAVARPAALTVVANLTAHFARPYRQHARRS